MGGGGVGEEGRGMVKRKGQKGVIILTNSTSIVVRNSVLFLKIHIGRVTYSMFLMFGGKRKTARP